MKRPPARRRSGFDSVPAYTRYDRNAKIRDTKPVHPNLWSIWSPGARRGSTRRFPRHRPEDHEDPGERGRGQLHRRRHRCGQRITRSALARRSRRTSGSRGAPPCSSGHVSVWGEPHSPQELEPRGHRLPALDAGLSRGGSAVMSARRTRRTSASSAAGTRTSGTPYSVLGSLHLAHLARHRVPHADPRAEAEPAPHRAGFAAAVFIASANAYCCVPSRRSCSGCDRGGRCDGRLHGVRERDAEAADAGRFQGRGSRSGLRLRQDPLLDLVEVLSRVACLIPAFLHLAEAHVDLLDELLADPVLDFREVAVPKVPTTGSRTPPATSGGTGTRQTSGAR